MFFINVKTKKGEAKGGSSVSLNDTMVAVKVVLVKEGEERGIVVVVVVAVSLIQRSRRSSSSNIRVLHNR